MISVVRIAAVLLLAFAFAAAAPVAAAGDSPASARSALPEGLPEGWYAKIETSAGTIVGRLLAQQAPQGVAHFAAFAEGRMTWTDVLTGEKASGPFYDGLEIHKIVPAERFEAGDPTGTGRGAPLVYVPIEVGGTVSFDRPYRIGLTRSAGAKVSGVMFFVTRAGLPHLSGRHPCIAEIVIGRDVVDAICATKMGADGKPAVPVKIDRVSILKIGSPPPIADPVPFTPVTPRLEARPRD